MERNTYTPILLKVSFQVRLKQRKPGKAWHHLVENQSEKERKPALSQVLSPVLLHV